MTDSPSTPPQSPSESTPAAAPVARFPAYLGERYRAWHADRYAKTATWYERLAREGQHPRTMIISCCDSRVDAVAMFGAEPGDLFVVRNVANLVPPYSPDHAHHGTSAAIEYAVRNLKVAHIVVVGHSGCGGVAACHDMCSGAAPALEDGASFIGRWMDILRPAYERVSGAAGGRDAQVGALEKEGVRNSIANLHGFPFVAEAVADGLLSLSGAWVDIGPGKLYALNPGTDVFEEV